MKRFTKREIAASFLKPWSMHPFSQITVKNMVKDHRIDQRIFDRWFRFEILLKKRACLVTAKTKEIMYKAKSVLKSCLQKRFLINRADCASYAEKDIPFFPKRYFYAKI